jgi:D-amino peptidase
MRRRMLVLMTAGVLAALPAARAQTRAFNVFISVDMEGLAGVVTGSDVTATGPDYAHFRDIMAGETNAAVAAAFDAGATGVVVRDSHGAKQNLRPSDVDPRARLLRGQGTGPKNMMEGIDETFQAVVFIGYHAKAGTPNAILEHTSNGNVIDFAINGVSLPEGGYNALVAGLYNVPVVFASGDRALTDQLRVLLGPIETVAVKEEIGGDASLGMSPQHAREAIGRGVKRGLDRRAELKPYVLAAPYTMTLKVRQERPLYKGAERVGPGESRFTSANLLDVLTAFNAMK